MAECRVSKIRKIKRRIGYQEVNTSDLKKKIYIEGELISEIGNEFQNSGPR